MEPPEDGSTETLNIDVWNDTVTCDFFHSSAGRFQDQDEDQEPEDSLESRVQTVMVEETDSSSEKETSFSPLNSEAPSSISTLRDPSPYSNRPDSSEETFRVDNRDSPAVSEEETPPDDFCCQHLYQGVGLAAPQVSGRLPAAPPSFLNSFITSFFILATSLWL